MKASRAYSLLSMVCLLVALVLLAASASAENVLVILHFSLACLFALLAMFSRRKSASTKGFFFASSSIALWLVAIFFLALLPRFYNESFDFSSGRSFELSGQLLNSLEQLDRDLLLTVYRGNQHPLSFREQERIELFRDKAAGRVKIDYLDPILEFGRARKGSKRGERFVLRSYENKDAFEVGLGFEDQDLIRALRPFVKSRSQVVQILSSESEQESEGRFSVFFELLRQRAFELRFVSEPQPGLPLLLLEPRGEPFDSKLEAALKGSLEQGGQVLILIEPGTESRTLSEYLGLELGNSLVIDQLQSWQGALGLGVQPVVEDFGKVEPALSFRSKGSLLFERATDIRPRASSSLPSSSYQGLLFSSSAAWAEKEWELLLRSGAEQVAFDASDRKGPLSLGVRVDLPSGAQALVVSDTTWLENSYVRLNSNFAFASASLVHLSKQQFTVPAPEFRELVPSAVFRELVFVSVLLPELLIILIFGFALFSRRRRGSAV